MGKTRGQRIFLVWLAVFFWGSAAPVVRYLILDGMDADLVSFLRIALTLCFATLFLLSGKARPRLSTLKTDFWPLLAMAFTGVAAFYWLLCTGLQHTQAGKGTLINAINPALIMLIAHFAFKEALGRRRILEMAATFTGVLLSVIGAADFSLHSFRLVSYDLMFVGTALCWSLYATINRRYGQHISYREALFWIFLLAGLLYTPVVVTRLGQLAEITAGQWLLLLYMGLCPGCISLYIWNIQVQELGMCSCGLINSFLPIAAVLISAIWLKETLTLVQLIGAALVVSGVWLGANKCDDKIAGL